ncbi:MAG: YraN family protein [Actinomycetota bacterium]|nr:YraN family protein [Actinomycetota bacterium]
MSPPRPGAAGSRRARAVASRDLGRAGEDLAADWYAARGYALLDRNWRCALGEIDLVCSSGPVLVVCEVKSRSSDRFGVPAEAVGAAKQLRLRRLAARYVSERCIHPVRVRFDVASVLAGEVTVLTAAF